MTRIGAGAALLLLALAGAPARAEAPHGAPAKDAHGDAHGAKTEEPPAEEIPPEEPLDTPPGEPQPEQPYKLVRTLERVQDRIAEGNTQAHGFQRQFIADIASKLAEMPDKTWKQPKNVRAAIVYVLSGGDPSLLGKLITMKGGLSEMTKTLARGVRAYAEGRNREAQKFLADIDHRIFDSRTAGHVALAKAMVTAGEDSGKALGFLDDARLFCTGTLVEEAALRRQVLLLSNVEDQARFELLASQYLRRFPRSIYARSFIRSLAIAVSTNRYSTDPELMARLAALIDDLKPETRRQVYTAITEEGVIRGKVQLTALATAKVLELVPPTSQDALRMQLYEAAARVVTPDYETAYAKLQAIDRARLSPSDTQLLNNALALGRELRQPIAETGPIRELPPLSSAAQVKHGAIAEKSETLDNVRDALSRADALLNKDRR